MAANIPEIFDVLRNYRFDSLPTYMMDWFGFHYPYFRHLLNTKSRTYTLRDGTYFVTRPFSYDRSIIDEIFIHKVYTPKHYDIQKGDTIIDIGAHIGAFTIFAAKKAKNEQTKNTIVYSYEPESTAFAILNMNVILNDLATEVKSFRNAVAGRRGVLSLYTNESGVASIVNQNSKSISAEAITLDDIFIKNKLSEVDFLKVDVEGAEWDIFNAARRGDFLTKIKKIVMECHSAKDTSRLKRLLKTVGFRVEISPAGHPTLAYLYAKRD